jgi:hypothetical protein
MLGQTSRVSYSHQNIQNSSYKHISGNEWCMSLIEKFLMSSLYRPGQALRAPGRMTFSEFLENRRTKVVRLSALGTGRLYLPEDISDTRFC